MTIKEAIYLLRNTAWLAPSLVPIDEAIEMACDALDKVEYINSQLGKADRKTEPLDAKGRAIQDAYDKGIISDASATQAWYEAVETEPQTGMPCYGCEFSKPYYMEYKCIRDSCKYEEKHSHEKET